MMAAPFEREKDEFRKSPTPEHLAPYYRQTDRPEALQYQTLDHRYRNDYQFDNYSQIQYPAMHAPGMSYDSQAPVAQTKDMANHIFPYNGGPQSLPPSTNSVPLQTGSIPPPSKSCSQPGPHLGSIGPISGAISSHPQPIISSQPGLPTFHYQQFQHPNSEHQAGTNNNSYHVSIPNHYRLFPGEYSGSYGYQPYQNQGDLQRYYPYYNDDHQYPSENHDYYQYPKDTRGRSDIIPKHVSGDMSAETANRNKCQVCKKQFRRPSSLRTHYFSHTGEKTFKCPWNGCGKLFSVKSNMTRHYRLHERKQRNLEEESK